MCDNCKENLNFDNFVFDKRISKHSGKCYKCRYKLYGTFNLETYNKNKIDIDNKNGWKICKDCKEKKLLNQFIFIKQDNRYDCRCIACKRKYKLFAYYKNKNNYKNKISDRISCEIWHCLKEGKNNVSWKKMVKFSLQDLIIHIELKFQTGMSWNNYGRNGWVIDHFFPIDLFKFDNYNSNEFQLCWNLKNLNPKWEKDNLKKSNYLPFINKRTSNLNELERLDYIEKYVKSYLNSQH